MKIKAFISSSLIPPPSSLKSYEFTHETFSGVSGFHRRHNCARRVERVADAEDGRRFAPHYL